MENGNTLDLYSMANFGASAVGSPSKWAKVVNLLIAIK